MIDGVKVGTTLLDVKALWTAALLADEIPVEQAVAGVFRSSRRAGAASVNATLRKSVIQVEKDIVLSSRYFLSAMWNNEKWASFGRIFVLISQ